MAQAQSFDPTVTVTKTYEGKTIQASKPGLVMTVPDSLKYFDLQFDYSVFDNPYKGAYEFNPYLMDIRPKADTYHGSEFYMKVGVGYEIKPIFEIVWSPEFKKRNFSMNLYGNLDSFFGEYKTISRVTGDDGSVDLTYDKVNGHWSGYDALTQVGLNGRFDGKKAVFTFNTDYEGIHTSQHLPYSAGFDLTPISVKQHRSYNSLKAGLNLCSKDNSVRGMVYDVRADYLFSSESSGNSIEYAPSHTGAIYSHEFQIGGMFTKGFNRKGGLCIEAGFDMATISGLDKSGGILSVVPKYILRRSKFTLDAGVRLEAPVWKHNIVSKVGQIIYPELKLRYSPFGKYFNIDLEVTGGDKLNTYGDMIRRDHHFSGLYTKSMSMPLLDATNEIIGFKLALSGDFKRGFRYYVAGGYRDYRSLPHYGAFGILDTSGEFLSPAPVMIYNSAKGFFADARLGWQNESWDIGGYFGWTNMSDGNDMTFDIPHYKASAHVRYNWRNRIFAGVTCDFVSESHAKLLDKSTEGQYVVSAKYPEMMTMPYFVDLSLDFEYRFSRCFSVCVAGGNLANMTIQRIPVYSDPGINFTIGICLRF